MTRVQNQRIQPRFRSHVPVRLYWNRRPFISISEDVSLGGIRLRTDAIPTLRNLVKLEVDLPGAPSALAMHAMVAHAGLDQDSPQATVGLQLYGIGETDRESWHAFVNAQTEAAKPDRSRRTGVVELRPRSKLDTARVNMAAKIGGRMFVDTALPLGGGDHLHLVMTDPTSGRLTALSSVVQRRIDRDGALGLLVEVAREKARDLPPELRAVKPARHSRHTGAGRLRHA